MFQSIYSRFTLYPETPQHLARQWPRRDTYEADMNELRSGSFLKSLDFQNLVGCETRSTLRLAGLCDHTLSPKSLCICVGEISVVRGKHETQWDSPSPSIDAGHCFL